MFQTFSDYLKQREWYGGEPGAESMASDQADQYGNPVRTTAMPQYGDGDKPITKKKTIVKPKKKVGKIKFMSS